MSNHISMRVRDTYQHKGSVVDTRIIDEDAAGIGPSIGMVYHALGYRVEVVIPVMQRS